MGVVLVLFCCVPVLYVSEKNILLCISDVMKKNSRCNTGSLTLKAAISKLEEKETMIKIITKIVVNISIVTHNNISSKLKNTSSEIRYDAYTNHSNHHLIL